MDLSERLKRAAEKSKAVNPVTWKRRPEVLCGPTVPLPLHGFAPRTIFGKAWWDRERKLAFLSTQYHCIACGTHHTCAKYHQWLEGHELYEYDYVDGVAYYLGTVPLCHFCHSYVHIGRLDRLLQRNQITHQKYSQIIQHAEEVLHAARISREVAYAGGMAEDSSWVVVIDGKEYVPGRSYPPPASPRRGKVEKPSKPPEPKKRAPKTKRKPS